MSLVTPKAAAKHERSFNKPASSADKRSSLLFSHSTGTCNLQVCKTLFSRRRRQRHRSGRRLPEHVLAAAYGNATGITPGADVITLFTTVIYERL